MILTSQPHGISSRYKIHWHLLVTHFPISFFTASAGFMTAHVFTANECFEQASFLTLVAGAIMLVPATLTGWYTWKKNYKGVQGNIFIYKIRISCGMLALAAILTSLRNVFLPGHHTMWHYVYAVGFLSLFVGSIAEGFYGGRLHHR
jgi:uncharacterized membrane protein